MKKIYQKPTINIVKVQVNNILTTVSNFEETTGTGANANYALGRAWDEWDD